MQSEDILGLLRQIGALELVAEKLDYDLLALFVAELLADGFG
jgi:hypothetical protein